MISTTKNRLVIYYLLILFSLAANAQELENGLIGHWPLDGNGDDVSVNSYNGIAYNTTAVIDRNGNSNSALSFDQNGYVALGKVLNIGYEDFSFSAWFRVDPYNTETGMFAILSKSHYGPEPQYAIGIHNNKLRTRFIYNSGIDIIGDKVIDDNEWHSFIVTINRNGNIEMYLDGILDTSASIADSPDFNVTNNFSLSIGQYEYKSYRFEGDLDEIRVYKRVLSGEEIALLSETEFTEEIKCENLITGADESVGIGADNPGGYGLAVDGGIYTDEVKVMNVDSWPDYVFSESYNLMELEALSYYIRERGHLPGVPSAREVFSGGISLTQMDKTNLKKVEELS
ncbi:hypothetical protein APR41_18095 [Salegentibacter salinarum]|uniref:Laminin G domain-containing protein n=1 Tax=Salegentibacter salinarum TaxID=447422 RepID=A0A2N0TTH3_9FLAO|nr:LamG domain-containing protein [Salegentibacter salinarum]PKD18025.1 hypothetical protein APR41_18095 [Salegentibacter salinarum]SKB99514.1 Concanavalin A-like lectin/glucanases superfamily protein [Salegentibacter salinarum]